MKHRHGNHAAFLYLLLTALTAASGAIIRVPLDAPTIAQALPLAGEGGVIQVAEGIHAGGFVISQTITIEGGYPPDFKGERDPWLHPTIIVAPPNENAVNLLLSAGMATHMTGLIFQDSATGIDASLSGDAVLTLDTITCRNNTRGLRLDLHDTSGIFATALTISGNTLDGSGSAVSVQADGDSILTINQSDIHDNSATAGGAGLFTELADNAAVSIQNTTLRNNGFLDQIAQAQPGSILYTLTGASALLIDASQIEGNIPAMIGDAAIGGTQQETSLVQMTACSVREGTTGMGAEAVDALLAGLSALRIVECSFENAADLNGPVIRAAPTEQAVVFLLRNRFADNFSSTHIIAVEQFGSSFVNLDGNVLRANTTGGAAIAASISAQAAGALVRAINNQVSANHSMGFDGGASFTIHGANIAHVGYNSFFGNTAQSGTAGIHLIASDASPAEVSNNACVQNQTDAQTTDLLVEGFLARQLGNFLTEDGDPRFIDAPGGDLRLRSDSPLIDAGDPNAFEIDHDFQEDPRPTGDGIDVGSDEFVRLNPVPNSRKP